MKDTLILDDDVASMLKRAPREYGETIERLGNELLRRCLRPLQSHRVESRKTTTRHFRVEPIATGRCLVDSLENVAEVLARAEGEDFR